MYYTTIFDLKKISAPTLTPDYDVMVPRLEVSDVIKFKIVKK